jgi:hypothetical protein
MVNKNQWGTYLMTQHKVLDVDRADLLRYVDPLSVSGAPEVTVLTCFEGELVYLIITFMETAGMGEEDLLELLNEEKCEHLLYPVFRNDEVLCLKRTVYNDPGLDCASLMAFIELGLAQLADGSYNKFNELKHRVVS